MDSSYNEISKDFTVIISIKNIGNIPANNIQSNMMMFFDGKEFPSNERRSRYVLFPLQENSGNPKFHNVEKEKLSSSELKIIVEINYEQPISSFLPIPVTIRKYKTTQELLYSHSYGRFSTISGSAT